MNSLKAKKENFQIKAYLLLYRALKKLYTFKIQKIVRNLKENGQKKLELETADDAQPDAIEKKTKEIERLEKQKGKIDLVTKDHLKMLTLHTLTEKYNMTFEKQQKYFEKELPDFIDKIELFNQEDNEDIQRIKWFEETIKDHKVCKETQEKLQFLLGKMEQVMEKNRARKKNRKENKKARLQGPQESKDGEGSEASEAGEDAEQPEGEDIVLDDQKMQEEGSDNGSDIVIDDEDFEDEKPNRRDFSRNQGGNNRRNENSRDNGREQGQGRRDNGFKQGGRDRFDRSQGRDNYGGDQRRDFGGQRQGGRRDNDRSQGRREGGFNQGRGGFDRNQGRDNFGGDQGRRGGYDRSQGRENYGGDRRDNFGGDQGRRGRDYAGGRKEFDRSQERGDRNFSQGRRDFQQRDRDQSRGDDRGGRDFREKRQFGRDNQREGGDRLFEGGNRNQGFGDRGGNREERPNRDQGGQGGDDKPAKKKFFDTMHPAWKSAIEAKQKATISAFQGTKEKLC